LSTQQARQLGEVDCQPPRFVFGEQIGGLAPAGQRGPSGLPQQVRQLGEIRR
jgi:hypothetical protein